MNKERSFESYSSKDCDKYPIEDVKESDRILSDQIINTLCSKEKQLEVEEKIKSPFITYCDSDQLELVLVYKNVKEDKKKCNWNLSSSEEPRSGMYGSAYISCCNPEDCEYVLKIDKYGYSCKEVYSMIRLSEKGLAPNLYEVWKVKNKGENIGTIFIMKKLKETLEIILKNLKREEYGEYMGIEDKLMDKLIKLYNSDISHGDLHLDNIMIGYDGEIYFIDFGKASSKDNDESQNKYFKRELKEIVNQLYSLSIYRNVHPDDMRLSKEDKEDPTFKIFEKLSKYVEPDRVDIKGTRYLGRMDGSEKKEDKEEIWKAYEKRKQEERKFYQALKREEQEREEQERIEQERRTRIIPKEQLLEMIKTYLEEHIGLLDNDENSEFALDEYEEEINKLDEEDATYLREYIINFGKTGEL